MTQYLTTLSKNVLVYTSSWTVVLAVCVYKRFLVIILYFTSGLLDSLLCQDANFGTSNALGLSAWTFLVGISAWNTKK
jgi:hypothetical protein